MISVRSAAVSARLMREDEGHTQLTIALWLVSYAYGSRRETIADEASGESVNARRRAYRPALPHNVLDMCGACGIDCSSSDTSELQVLGVVRCKPGRATGVLTSWTSEEQALLKYWTGFKHCYSLVVEDVWILPSPIAPPVCKLSQMKFCKASQCLMVAGTGMMLVAAHAWPSARLPMMSPGDLLKSWGLECSSPPRLPMVPVVCPVAVLILRREWQAIVLLARFHFPTRGVSPSKFKPFQKDWPTNAWLQSVAAPDVVSALSFSHQVLATFAQRLRSWAPVLSEHGGFGVEEELSDMLSSLDSAAMSLEADCHLTSKKRQIWHDQALHC